MGMMELGRYGIERELNHVGERYRDFPYAFFARRIEYSDWKGSIMPWCEERFGLSGGDVWRTSANVVWFKDKDHAMEFKLRWV
jgi:hypothetical protein